MELILCILEHNRSFFKFLLIYQLAKQTIMITSKVVDKNNFTHRNQLLFCYYDSIHIRKKVILKMTEVNKVTLCREQ